MKLIIIVQAADDTIVLSSMVECKDERAAMRVLRDAADAMEALAKRDAKRMIARTRAFVEDK
jgi:hypothetical protein